MVRGEPWLSSENRPILVVIFFHPWDPSSPGSKAKFWFSEEGKNQDRPQSSPGGGREVAWEVKKNKVEEVEFQWKFIHCRFAGPQIHNFSRLDVCCAVFWDHSSLVQDKKPWQRDHELVQSAGGKSFEPRLLTNWHNSWILWELSHCWVSLVKVKGKRKGMDEIFWGLFIWDFNKQAALKYYLTVDWGGSQI